jgi:hypothetical protein
MERGFLAKRPSSSSLVRHRSEAGEARAAAARRPPGHVRDHREGEKGEGDEGILTPHSPWTEAARGESSTGGGGPVVVVLGAAQMVVGGCRASLLGAVWGSERAALAFYRP